VSYLNDDKTSPSACNDLKLANMLLSAGHMSPFEHQATPMTDFKLNSDKENLDYLIETLGVTHLNDKLEFYSGNFKNWIQYRQII
jgi:hypothetical protein